ncbi:solute carrier family 2, facilitated glucose transporter member 11b isoform X1 [Pimephales promelas]|uniref:solute carrier family 2, facilitated glucose transporter member 11b isoform X1 n=2 Tax=Pimephales promelas TaxID=90988 RepID=UPI0019557EE4|nr:solute carrier family 2, facilitated glucose transporter member 11b isoform X1 [Pimephales promelas]KAG1957923.1 solute carrier family 2, facilitated glucose transporter [Pimephales promelas]
MLKYFGRVSKMGKDNGELKEYQPLLKDFKEPVQQIKVPSKYLLLAVWASGIGGTFQYGYNISIINAPTKSVQNFINQTWTERYNTEISTQMLTLLWSTIVSIFTLGGLVGASVGGTLAIRFGRKGTLLFNNTFALLAAFFMGLSYPSRTFELLIIGRFLSGVNAGIAICVQPLYIGEIAPRALRGAMSMGTSIFITGGILTGQVIGLKELLGKEEYWPILLSTTCIPALLQLLSLPWFPESPRYLLIDRGDDVACTKALTWFHGPDNYHGEKADIERERDCAIGIKPKKPWELFKDSSLRWQLLTLFVIHMSQQLNGINAIYFYADYVFTQAGIPDDKIPYATVGTGACECITALTCGLLIESLGRRALIIGGYSLMSLCCVCFTVALTFQESSTWVPYLSMACVFAFILSFGLGPGGVTNILTTEMFTQTDRPAAYMISGSINWTSFFVIGMIFPFIVNGLKQYCFLVFLVICCLVATYIFFVVPETKNKTFLEIQSEFRSRKKCTAANGTEGPLLSTSM